MPYNKSLKGTTRSTKPVISGKPIGLNKPPIGGYGTPPVPPPKKSPQKSPKK